MNESRLGEMVAGAVLIGGMDWIISSGATWSVEDFAPLSEAVRPALLRVAMTAWALPAWNLDAIAAWIRDGYRHAPALILGLGAAVSLPVLALIGLFVIRRRPASPPPAHDDDVPKTLPASAWRQRAWIELADGSHRRVEINRNLLRIGREDDNDMQLVHASIHRYHAVIERSPDMIFSIQDLSGPDGGGVLVDGVRIERARLRGGERLDIGGVSLKFHLSAAS
ncbi:MAG: FHA domain-containing protein [Hyphomicrobiaceae bacterium]|nr:FHA domain-containing protein [Hyphomicrobiaceae bacterium]